MAMKRNLVLWRTGVDRARDEEWVLPRRSCGPYQSEESPIQTDFISRLLGHTSARWSRAAGGVVSAKGSGAWRGVAGRRRFGYDANAVDLRWRGEIGENLDVANKNFGDVAALRRVIYDALDRFGLDF